MVSAMESQVDPAGPDVKSALGVPRGAEKVPDAPSEIGELVGLMQEKPDWITSI